MMALLISMLKITIPSKKLIIEWLGVDNNKVNRFGVGKNGVRYVRKSGKSSKSRKSKSKKMSKSQNLAKSRKKLSKNGNFTNFHFIKDELKFLTPDIRTAFNCLQLIFTKAPIL